MDTAGKFAGERGIDQAVALDPALPSEGIRHDIHPEMSLAAGTMPGMSFVPVGFILHPQALRGESRGQFLCDEILHGHSCAIAYARPSYNRQAALAVRTPPPA